MHDEQNWSEQNLDALLDHALASYTSPEPSPDLADRILAATSPNTFAARDSRRRWQPWAVATAAAALLLAALISPHRTPKIQVPQLSTQASLQASPEVLPRIDDGSPRPPQHARPSSRATISSRGTCCSPAAHRAPHSTEATQAGSSPEQNTFPTPQPLTPQEQALVSLMKHSSASEIASPAPDQSPAPPVDPIYIAAIEIQPLAPPHNGGNK